MANNISLGTELPAANDLPFNIGWEFINSVHQESANRRIDNELQGNGKLYSMVCCYIEYENSTNLQNGQLRIGSYNYPVLSIQLYYDLNSGSSIITCCYNNANSARTDVSYGYFDSSLRTLCDFNIRQNIYEITTNCNASFTTSANAYIKYTLYLYGANGITI